MMLKVLDGNLKDEHYLSLNSEALIVALNSKGKALGIVLSSIMSQEILDFVNHSLDQLEEDRLTFKVVGASYLVNGVATILKPFSDNEVKIVPRDGGFECFFFPNDGKLRVTKSKEAPNVLSTKVNEKVKVLIVDDSKTIRSLLSKIFADDENIEVVATAEKPSDVEELIVKHKPDVMTLDIHMPEMTGVDLLKILQPKYNIPTIMVTSISMEEGPLVLEALEHGAFDYFQKPEMSEVKNVAEQLIEKVKEAAVSSKKGLKNINKVGSSPVKDFNQESLILIGSSTGGTNALKDIFRKLPDNIPPTIVVQHIPPVFSKAFADRMNNICPFTVKEAEDGEEIENNKILIAPGGKQLKIVQSGAKYIVEINDDAPVNRFKPSVDYMFASAMPLLKRKHIVSVMLTGMGKDGSREMLNLKNGGSYTIAQNEESCVVYGMPRAAVEIGAAMAIEHKDDIAAKMAEYSWPNKDEKSA